MSPDETITLANASFTAATVKQLVRLNYRQLNDWETRAGIGGEARTTPDGWRRFTWPEVCALQVCRFLLDSLGLPLERAGWLYQRLARKSRSRTETAGEDFAECAFRGGANCTLLTDLSDLAEVLPAARIGAVVTALKCRKGQLLILPLEQCLAATRREGVAIVARMEKERQARAERTQISKTPRRPVKRSASTAAAVHKAANTNRKGRGHSQHKQEMESA